MKTFFLSLIIMLGAMTAYPVGATAFRHSSPSAKECSDCGCSGPGSDGVCPMEKGKKCHCK